MMEDAEEKDKNTGKDDENVEKYNENTRDRFRANEGPRRKRDSEGLALRINRYNTTTL